MYMSSSLRIVRRWWWSAAALLLATAGVVGYLVASVPADYEVTSTVILIQSSGNPFAHTNQNIDVLERSVAATIGDNSNADLIAGSGAPAAYSVAESKMSVPALVVTCKSRQIGSAVATCASVVQEVGSSLAAIQRDFSVPTGQQIRSVAMGAPSIRQLTKNRDRLLIAVGAVGGVTSVLSIFALDGMAARRRAGRRIRASAVTVILGGLVLISSVAGLTVKRAPARFQADQVAILVPPRLPPNPRIPPDRRGTENPFQSYSLAFNVLAQMATVHATDLATRARLDREGAGAHYSVVNWIPGPTPVSTVGTPTPFLTVSASAADAATARRTVQAVIGEIAHEVENVQLQQGIPRLTWITAQQITPPQVHLLHMSRARALSSLLVLGGAVGFGLWRGWSYVMRRRRRRATPIPDGPGIRRAVWPTPWRSAETGAGA